HTALDRLLRNVQANLTAEQVVQLAALAQALDHRVEPVLQLPDLAAVIDGHPYVEVSVRDVAHRFAHRVDRLGDGLRGEDHRGRAGDQTGDREEDESGDR